MEQLGCNNTCKSDWDNDQVNTTEHTLNDSDFKLFRDLIYTMTGIALTDAKRNLVQGRLQKRLRFHQVTRFRDYYNLLRDQGEKGAEITEFINCITTNKTDFFREPHHFDFITQHVIPQAAERAAYGEAPRRLRIWHAGCSTGEEPYTLAITLAEALKDRERWDIRQLASDIDTNVLAHAQAGIYDEDKIAPIPQPLLKKYFMRGRAENNDKVKVRAELRAQITFKQINLLSPDWPINPRAKFDIIFCRNVVIYFDKPTQRKLFARYQQLLRPGGYLFIGHSESLLGISDAFESLGKTIYRLPENAGREAQAA